MNTQEPPLIDHRGRPGDDLDGILRAFFKSELPRPWPEAPLPESLPSPVLNGHATLPFARPAQPWRLGSRLALAASLGGLVVGTVLLSGHFQGTPPTQPNLGDGSGKRMEWIEFKDKEMIFKQKFGEPPPNTLPDGL